MHDLPFRGVLKYGAHAPLVASVFFFSFLPVKFVGYPISEAEWHTYTADDPSWEDDIGLVVAYQSLHGLPPRPSGRRRQGLVSNSVPPPLPTPLPSTPLVPVVQPSPPQRRTTRQTRDAVLTAGLCY